MWPTRPMSGFGEEMDGRRYDDKIKTPSLSQSTRISITIESVVVLKRYKKGSQINSGE